MSAAILIDPNHRQNHMDDMESLFYVLIWTLLHYSLCNKLENSHHLARIFDEVADTGATEGDLKQLFLILRSQTLVFFNHSLLNKLVQELALTFAMRYGSPPEKALLALFESDAGAQISRNPIIRRQNLNRWWLIEVIQKYLEDQSQRLNEDAACLNIAVPARKSTRRRIKQGH